MRALLRTISAAALLAVLAVPAHSAATITIITASTTARHQTSDSDLQRYNRCELRGKR